MNVIAKLADAALGKVPTSTSNKPVTDNEVKMHALSWHGAKSITYDEKPKPCITDDTDIILKITATTICGSDLHMYSGRMVGMHDGDILGHEFMGIVEEKGSNVKNIEVGQRVVVAFDIACGQCEYCQREEYTGCCTTNSSRLQGDVYGHRTCAMYGYSHVTGGVPGGQAEYVRVAFADVNCLPIPDDVPDEKALYLSDIIPTSYFGTEMGEVKEGSIVAIWGLGPIGLSCARWCQIRKAGRIIGIDCVPERLSVAKDVLGIEIINFNEKNTVKALQEMVPRGIDVAIECAGFEYPKTILHKVETALSLETDTADILDEMIICTRPFGHVAILGVYVGYCNHFPIGAMMEKGLTVRGGQSPTQKFWKMALEKIRSGEFDPSFVVTHKRPLSDGPELYTKFADRSDGVIKVFLRPATWSGNP